LQDVLPRVNSKNYNRMFLILILSLPVAEALRGIVREVVDRGILTSDAFRRLTYSSSYEFSNWVTILETVTQIILILMLGFKNFRSRRVEDKKNSILPISLASTIMISLTLNLSNWQWQRSLQVFMFCFVIVFVNSSDVVKLDFHQILNAYFLIFIFSVLYTFVFPRYSLSPCKSQKCSFLGTLNTSFYPHEQGYSLFLIVLIGLLIGVHRRLLSMKIIFIVIVLISTGSRTGLVAYALMVIFFLTRKFNLMGLIVKTFVSISILLLLFSPSKTLTGRGQIYEFIRNSWEELIIAGGGMNFINDKFWSGTTLSFLPHHEHGVIPTSFARFGLVVTILFAIVISHSTYRLSGEWIKPVVVGVSCYGITEASMYPSFQNPVGWVVALIILNYLSTGNYNSVRSQSSNLKSRFA